MAESQDHSLQETFSPAKSELQDLEQLDPRTDVYTERLDNIIQHLGRCRNLIDKLSIFSPNEELEDISTQNLRYLTVDYLLADALLKSYKDTRLKTLRRTSELLEAYLARLDQYRMLSQQDQKLLERYRENRSSFSLVASSRAEDKRNIKIARFQQEKSLKRKLEHLHMQSQSVNADDEIIRDLHLAEIAFYVHQAFQSLDLIILESSMLKQMEAADAQHPRQANERAPDAAGSDGYSERLDGPVTMAGLGRRGGPLLDQKGKPLQPFTILDRRSQMQHGVFRPGHNLPTMTIDEYLEEEKRRGGIIDGGGSANAPQAEPDEDDMAAVDEATMKAREWDEFVEANPKGAGNTLNKG